MVRALTEPFGHVAELYFPEQQYDLAHGGRATVVYCCSSSASLARLALHGLVIGKSCVQAALGEFVPTITEHDTDAVNVRPCAAFLSRQPGDPEHSTMPTLLRDTPASGTMLRQMDVAAAHACLTEAAAPAFPQQQHARGCSVRPDPWRTSDVSGEAAVMHALEDPVLNERVSLS